MIFGIVGNVGHMDGNNIGVVNLSPYHQKPHKELANKVDQYRTMEPTIHVPLMHALKISNNELHGQQYPQHNINNTLCKKFINDKNACPCKDHPHQ